MVSVLDDVRLKYDFSDVLFMSSSVKPVGDDYDTSQFCGQNIASVGSLSSIKIGDNTVYFKENIVNTHTRINSHNLARIKYLNLRHSSISDIET